MRSLTAQWIANAVQGELVGDVDTLVTSVEKDSRAVRDGSLYVAFVGERVDGHDFVSDAVARGAVLSLVSQPVASPHILVEDVTLALGELARAYVALLRTEGTITVVGNEAAVSHATVSELVAAAAPAVPAPHAGASTAVETAKAQLGDAYLWGGSGPDAFDCSGLTSFAWSAAGVELVHQSKLQHESTRPVPTTMLQPGDLLFYGRPVHHVGIYVGDGMMVEAANSSVPVRTSSIWRADLIGASRPGT